MKHLKTKSKPKVKEPISLRQKPLKNGGFSLYLDCYVNGNRWYEFLKLYLVPENVSDARNRNNETLSLAASIQGKRIAELQNETHGFSNSKMLSKTNLLNYIEKLANHKKEQSLANGKKKGGRYSPYMNLLFHLKQFRGDNITFQHVDKSFCMDYIDYLRTAVRHSLRSKKRVTLCQNTQLEYLNLFSAVLNEAVADDIIQTNPLKHVKKQDKPKSRLPEIEYLTNQELNILANTPYEPDPAVRRAFLFSCYTGLRFSDIENLTWGKLRKNDAGRTLIKFVQEKTSKPEYPPISEKAVRWLPERGSAKDDDRIFDLPDNCYTNVQLRKWTKKAGLKKRITYHVSRHTAATLLLSLGVALTTVQKIMGHSDIKTTLRYAKVIDKNISDAVDKLDNLPDIV
jgi:integrase